MKKLSLCVVMLSIIFSLSACCSEMDYGKQDVDVQPLYDAQLNLTGVEKLSDVIDTNMFDQVIIDKDSYLLAGWAGPSEKVPGIDSAARIDISFTLSEEEKAAREDFNVLCTSRLATNIKFYGEENNQYCVSHLWRYRGDPEGACLPTDDYFSFVVIQKGRLVISINETIYNERGRDFVFSKSAVIQFLAQELTKQSQ